MGRIERQYGSDARRVAKPPPPRRCFESDGIMTGTVILILIFIGVLELWNSGRLKLFWEAANGTMVVKPPA